MVRNEKTRNLYFWVNLLFDVIQVFLIIQMIIKYNIKKNHTKQPFDFFALVDCDRASGSVNSTSSSSS